MPEIAPTEYLFVLVAIFARLCMNGLFVIVVGGLIVGLFHLYKTSTNKRLPDAKT